VFESYRKLPSQYQKISLDEERILIGKAQEGSETQAQELVLRHIQFVIFRIQRIIFPSHIQRFGEDLLSQAILTLYQKIKTYDLEYKDKKGELKPVKFTFYIWKRIDGLIIDFLKKEFRNERKYNQPNWETFDHEDHMFEMRPSLSEESKVKNPKNHLLILKSSI